MLLEVLAIILEVQAMAHSVPDASETGTPTWSAAAHPYRCHPWSDRSVEHEDVDQEDILALELVHTEEHDELAVLQAEEEEAKVQMVDSCSCRALSHPSSRARQARAHLSTGPCAHQPEEEDHQEDTHQLPTEEVVQELADEVQDVREEVVPELLVGELEVREEVDQEPAQDLLLLIHLLHHRPHVAMTTPLTISTAMAATAPSTRCH